MLKLNQLESAYQVSTSKNRHIRLQSIIYIWKCGKTHLYGEASLTGMETE